MHLYTTILWNVTDNVHVIIEGVHLIDLEVEHHHIDCCGIQSTTFVHQRFMIQREDLFLIQKV